jgi:hypothetical protein
MRLSRASYLISYLPLFHPVTSLVSLSYLPCFTQISTLVSPTYIPLFHPNYLPLSHSVTSPCFFQFTSLVSSSYLPLVFGLCCFCVNIFTTCYLSLSHSVTSTCFTQLPPPVSHSYLPCFSEQQPLTWEQIDEIQHESIIQEISELVHMRLVSGSLEGTFRNVLEFHVQVGELVYMFVCLVHIRREVALVDTLALFPRTSQAEILVQPLTWLQSKVALTNADYHQLPRLYIDFGPLLTCLCCYRTMLATIRHTARHNF